MPTRPATIDATKYRQVKFIGGKILQDRELNLLEDLEKDLPAKGKYNLGALFPEGATLNVQPVVSGNTVTLARIENDHAMLVLVNGCFEEFTAAPVVFSAKPDKTQDRIYANYVIWRVSGDSNAQDVLYDPALVDADTQEPAAEMGQIQVYSGSDDSGPVDASLMFARNTVALPMFTFEWDAAGTLNWVGATTARPQALAGGKKAGMVKLSTATSTTAAADDDPRLNDTRVPTDATVNTRKVQPAAATGQQVTVHHTDETGADVSDSLDGVKIGDTDGGINAKRVFWDGWGAALDTSLGLIWRMLQNLYGIVKGSNDRITALENTPALDLGFHVGHGLGEAQSHPPAVDATVSGAPDGFTVSSAADAAKYAYLARTKAGAVLGGVHQNGDYEVTDASLMDPLKGLDFRRYVTFAKYALNFFKTYNPAAGVPESLDGDVGGGAASTLIGKIKGKSVAGLPDASVTPSATQMVVFNPSSNRYELAAIPSGGGATALSGDVNGSPAANTVSKIQGKPVSAAQPATNDVLTWDGSNWAPKTLQTGAVLSSALNGTPAVGQMGWNILQFGNYKVAFGSGVFQNGQVFGPPASDWNKAVMAGSWGPTTVSVALAAVPAGGGYQAVVENGSGNTKKVTINAWNGGSLSGAYASVTVTAIGQEH